MPVINYQGNNRKVLIVCVKTVQLCTQNSAYINKHVLIL